MSKVFDENGAEVDFEAAVNMMDDGIASRRMQGRPGREWT